MLDEKEVKRVLPLRKRSLIIEGRPKPREKVMHRLCPLH
jgi:hypothetical protein